jgi:hypothetical protein
MSTVVWCKTSWADSLVRLKPPTPLKRFETVHDGHRAVRAKPMRRGQGIGRAALGSTFSLSLRPSRLCGVNRFR